MTKPEKKPEKPKKPTRAEKKLAKQHFLEVTRRIEEAQKRKKP